MDILLDGFIVMEFYDGSYVYWCYEDRLLRKTDVNSFAFVPNCHEMIIVIKTKINDNHNNVNHVNLIMENVIAIFSVL